MFWNLYSGPASVSGLAAQTQGVGFEEVAEGRGGLTLSSLLRGIVYLRDTSAAAD